MSVRKSGVCRSNLQSSLGSSADVKTVNMHAWAPGPDLTCQCKVMWLQVGTDLKAHQSDRSAAKDAIAKATGIREKEAAAFAKTSSDLKTNLAALGKAISAIEKGVGGFLQTSAASVLRSLSCDN